MNRGGKGEGVAGVLNEEIALPVRARRALAVALHVAAGEVLRLQVDGQAKRHHREIGWLVIDGAVLLHGADVREVAALAHDPALVRIAAQQVTLADGVAVHAGWFELLAPPTR